MPLTLPFLFGTTPLTSSNGTPRIGADLNPMLRKNNSQGLFARSLTVLFGFATPEGNTRDTVFTEDAFRNQMEVKADRGTGWDFLRIGHITEEHVILPAARICVSESFLVDFEIPWIYLDVTRPSFRISRSSTGEKLASRGPRRPTIWTH